MAGHNFRLMIAVQCAPIVFNALGPVRYFLAKMTQIAAFAGDNVLQNV